MAKNIEITIPIVVLLTAWRAGAPIMKFDGKTTIKKEK
jgi:hypothetical protein